VRITLYCVGRLGRTAEGALAVDYAERAALHGRALALGPVEIIEVEARHGGKTAEGEALLGKIAEGALLVACDEQGATHTSRQFASKLEGWRDAGERHLAFAIGGADGLDRAVLERARERLAFGPQTWPHALARVMLAEQVYRAVTILTGSPYHRD
jgi:23S rRNA (pseudouridine1915-N3)-methyltransferase